MSRYDVDSMALISQVKTCVASKSMLFARNFINISQLIQKLLQSHRDVTTPYACFLCKLWQVCYLNEAGNEVIPGNKLLHIVQTGLRTTQHFPGGKAAGA
jgi:hypothetical protein